MIRSKTRLANAAADPAGNVQRAGTSRTRKELKKSGETRQRILDAAARVFARNGFGRTAMTDIAAEIGVHVTGLYYHFDTKDDLAEAVINHVARQSFEALTEKVSALPPGTPFVERLRVAIHAQLEHNITWRDYIMAQAKLLSELPEERQERHRALLREFGVFWRNLLAQGRRSGALRPGPDPGIARMILLGSLNWAVEWYRPGGRSIADIADQITDMTLNGLGAADTGR